MIRSGLAALALFAGVGIAGPAELLPPDLPNGYELSSEPARDLTFDEYAELAPDAVAHIDPSAAEAREMRAAIDVWTLGEDDVLIREVTEWGTDGAALDFVGQSLVVGTLNDLEPTDAPFDGGVAFIAADRGLWTRTLTWRQGPYAMSVSHFSVTEGNDGILTRTSRALADSVRAGTGHEIDTSGVPTGAAEPAGSEGGVPIGTMLTWAFVIGAAAWVARGLARRRRATSIAIGHRSRPAGSVGAAAGDRAERDTEANLDASDDRS